MDQTNSAHFLVSLKNASLDQATIGWLVKHLDPTRQPLKVQQGNK